MIPELVVILIGVTTAAVVWLRWNYGRWKKAGIPKYIPNSFPGAPAVGTYHWRSPVLLLRDIELVKAVTMTEFASFRDNGKHISKKADPILGRNPFFLEGDEWKMARKVHTQSHTANKLKTLFGYVDEVSNDLIGYISNNTGKEIELLDFCSKFTIDNVSSCVFGIKTRSHTERDSEFTTSALNLFSFNWKWVLQRYAPFVLNIFRIRLINPTSISFFYNLVKEMSEMRKKQSLTRPDFLQILLDDPRRPSLMDMTAETLTFLIDGYATSSVEMTYMMYLLAIHPDVQSKLRDEVNSADELNFETIHRLPYMEAVFNETLRLYPAAPTLSRKCTSDTVITHKDKKYEFSKGDIVEIPVYAIHRDPEYFQNPSTFDPDRFIDNSESIPLLALGLGPRACVGNRFARTQIKTGVAKILKRFRVVPATDDHSFPKTTHQNILLYPDDKLFVKFENL
ncbi:hypothetical protein GE061_009278 [Apolygus lucorum]|uniref:Cytochrome P450 n=1 Tax=Apolygus lucorum TaxID=248454 RepID=A0A6A4K8N7_APOLU|nr:hypothetical protein GE061_009278 [Apolygus lucorum]